MPRPTYTPPPNPAPSLGDPNFSANASGYLGWFPSFGAYTEAMADWYETGFAKELEDGTAAAPSLAFRLDPKTGIYRFGPDVLGFSTDGVSRATLGVSAFNINLPITGAAVQSSPTDFTPGKIMLTGSALAINTLPVIGNASVTDNSIKTGFYAYQLSGGAISSGGPAGASFGTLWHSKRTASGGEAQMMLVDSGSSAAPPGSVWSRTRLTGEWSSWTLHYTQRNVLGTVSQSGGAPTGALIETGSNANGRWEKYANGTMNVTRTILNFSDVTVASGNIFQSLEVPFDFPVTFIEPPVVSLSVRSSSSVWGNGRPTSNNAGVGRLYAPISIAGLIIVDIEVTGRWF